MVDRVNSVILVFCLSSMQCIVRQCGGEDGHSSRSDEDTILNDALLLVKLLKNNARETNMSVLFPEWSISAPGSPQSPLSVLLLKNGFQTDPEHSQGTLYGNYRRNMLNDIDATNVSRPLASRAVTATVLTIEPSATIMTLTTTESAAPMSKPTSPKRVSLKSTRPFKSNGLKRKRHKNTVKIHKSSKKTTLAGKQTRRMYLQRRDLGDDNVNNEINSTEVYNQQENDDHYKQTNNDTIQSQINKQPIQPKVIEESTQPKVNDDPISSQVRAEMKNELNALSKKDKNTRKGRIEKSVKFTKCSSDRIRTRKPTFKIYLGKSSRYPLPLPQNHAFCFTDPNNGLCKSLI